MTTYVTRINGVWVGGGRRMNMVYLPESAEILDLLRKYKVI